MGAPVVKDDAILVAPVKETKPSDTVVFTFVLDNMKAAIQATGGSFEETVPADAAATVRTEGCDDDNILINWGGKAGAKVSGTAEITWTAPSKAGFSVDFLAITGTGFGSEVKYTTFTISDSDGVAVVTDAPTAKTVDVGSSSTDDDSSLSGDDSAAFRVEIPMALMITLFIGLLKF